MGKIEKLVEVYAEHVRLPWSSHAAAPERTWFVVYDPPDERRLRLQLEAFANATRSAGHEWRDCDLTDAFPQWLAADEYHEEYFREPDAVRATLEEDFLEFAAARAREAAQDPGCDENAVLAVYGTASLFGLIRVSDFVSAVLPSVRGRLAVLFPGSFIQSVYRHLDAVDGWNYHAVPITVKEG